MISPEILGQNLTFVMHVDSISALGVSFMVLFFSHIAPSPLRWTSSLSYLPSKWSCKVEIWHIISKVVPNTKYKFSAKFLSHKTFLKIVNNILHQIHYNNFWFPSSSQCSGHKFSALIISNFIFFQWSKLLSMRCHTWKTLQRFAIQRK